jgi:hypothetical protein
MTGTQRFQIEQGTVEGSDFDMDMAIVMAMKAPATPSARAAAPTKPVSRGQRAKSQRAKAAARPTNAGTKRMPPAGEALNARFGLDGSMKMTLERLPAVEVSEAS